MIRVTFRHDKFLGKCSREDAGIFQAAKWNYKKSYDVWFTTSPMRAKLLSHHMDKTAKIQLCKSVLLTDLWKSRPSRILIPNGLKLLEHQPIAITFALQRNKSYLGLDPGLGKTIVAAILAYNLGGRIIYICPPFLVTNTREEFLKWAPNCRITTLDDGSDSKWFDVLIVPDSMIHRADVREFLELHASYGETTLFIDEAHRFKNDESRRTKSLLGERRSKKRGRKVGIVEFQNILRIIPMSGTPMPNKPIELYGILDRLAPETIQYMDKFSFGRKFCGGHRDENGYWDFNGASNMRELQRRVMSKFMLRQKKNLLNLPPKIEEVIILNGKASIKIQKITSAILKKYSPEDLIKKQIAKSIGTSEEELHIATYRRMLGIEKIKDCMEFTKAILEETDEKLIIFGVHKDVISETAKLLEKYNPLVITGQTKNETRHKYVKEFQNNKNRRVIIGNIQAMGVGFTLTKAERILFFEWTWVPGDNDQAGDRAHRIGLKHSVLVQFLVKPYSLDRPIIETLLRKRSATQYI